MRKDRAMKCPVAEGMKLGGRTARSQQSESPIRISFTWSYTAMKVTHPMQA